MNKTPTNTTEKEAMINALVQKFRQQLEAQLPDDDALTLDQIEDIAAVFGSGVTQDVQSELKRKPSS